MYIRELLKGGGEKVVLCQEDECLVRHPEPPERPATKRTGTDKALIEVIPNSREGHCRSRGRNHYRSFSN